MRFIKISALAVVAVLVTMAMTGTALATGPTALCKEHKDPCPEGELYGVATLIEGLAIDPAILGTLFGFTVTVLCEHSVVSARIENHALNSPLLLQMEKISFTGNCTSTFGSCTVTTVKLNLMTLLRTALNLGVATSSGNQFRVVCKDFPEFECTFGGSPQLHAEGTPVKHWTAKEASLVAISGSACPTNPRWDALYKIIQPTGNVFIST